MSPDPQPVPTGDPAFSAAHQLYRQYALAEFAGEMKMGLHLAFYRSFVIPDIAKLLAGTGEIQRHPNKRAMDTGLLMYELIHDGPDGDRGREVVRMLNRMHHRYNIPQDQYRYILATFVVQPTRWVAAVGARALTAAEREATAVFYSRVGALMAIRNAPSTYSGYETLLDDYEAQHLAPSAAAVKLMASTQPVFADRLPKPLRPWADQLVAAMISEPKIIAALGLKPPARAQRLAVRSLVSMRRLVKRLLPRRTTSTFHPGQHAASLYPGGYQLSDLGIDAAPRDDS